jgi:error-prone DNA polymerase
VVDAPPYVPLWVKSAYSFLEGASTPDQLVTRAHGLALPAVALTDRDGVYGVVRAHVRAKALGLPLVLGAQVTSEAGDVVLLARDRAGWASLTTLLTTGRGRSPKGESLVHVDELKKSARGTIALAPSPALLTALRESHGDALYALCARHLRDDERAPERRLREAARRLDVPVVAANEVLYHDRAQRA